MLLPLKGLYWEMALRRTHVLGPKEFFRLRGRRPFLRRSVFATNSLVRDSIYGQRFALVIAHSGLQLVSVKKIWPQQQRQVLGIALFIGIPG